MPKKTKVLLTKGHAVNNGDMALVYALYTALEKKGFEVSIATFHYEFLKEKYPDLPLVRELLDYNLITGATFIKKIFLKINYLINKKYKKFDVYISSPGGYLNSYYGLKKSLLPLVEAKKSHKKTAVYSQSIGPLNERDISLLEKYSKFIDLILVRDNYSKECISSINCSSSILQTKDAAFLLEPKKSKADPNSKLVAVSVRSWKHDNRNMEHYHNLIQNYCEKVLEKGYDIEFISTCQGVKGYVDDSITAEIIKQKIIKSNKNYQESIHIDSEFNSYFDLVKKLNTKYCFVIGTRLHMCILSLINGTPAFNISYEVKGKECYEYLGYNSYSADFNEDISIALSKFEDFISNYKNLKESLYDKIYEIHKESKEHLNEFINLMKMS
ncbi:polysaccharide pyruvyl transferase family protein [Tenacibaculum geojense]|uniref:Polysaccharide pyruvyl transferase family protein n=1 Tax=Tenacibaculum geojense TaxID=915352 RepID=A0ABW3JNH7_9FLAO